MPSVKWVIAIEKRSTQLTESGVFYFRELPGLLQKKRRHQRDQRAPAELKTGLSFLGANREVGVRCSHLETVLQAYVAAPQRV